jgi:glutaredoxin-like protein NrdH
LGYLLRDVNAPDPVDAVRPKGESMDQPKVFLYALSTCGHCRNTKRLLDENNVQYDFVDVDLLPKDEMNKVLDEVRKVNPQCAFPTLLIGDKVIIGYRELEILEALGL